MDIYDRIKALREDNDMTQEQLAQITNVTTRHIRRWEAKESEMGITKLIAICEYFNVSADYILGLPRGLSWPREEDRRKTYNPTKYTFLLRVFGHLFRITFLEQEGEPCTGPFKHAFPGHPGCYAPRMSFIVTDYF